MSSITRSNAVLQSGADDVEKRQAHKIPKTGEGTAAPTQLVFLHHPGWEDINESTLFTLPTCSINLAKEACAEYLVAWQACYALAIEKPGFFTKKRERHSERVPPGQGLTAGHYWYHLDNDEQGECYATLLSFRAWRYSPEKMPGNWPAAVPWRGKEDDDQEDGDCCITGEDFVQKAHLIARTEWEWWAANGMTDHAGTTGVTSATPTIGQEMSVPGNLITLSDAMHRLWDTDFFCLFPLEASDGQWRLHCIFLLPLQKAIRNHHRRPVRGGLVRASAACAWARFVFSICRKYERTFLTKNIRRKLGGSKVDAEWMEATQILQQRLDRVKNTNPTKKSGSGSSRKRDRTPSQADSDDVYGGIDADYTGDEHRSKRIYHIERDSAVEVSPGFSPDRGRTRTRSEDNLRATLGELMRAPVY